MAGFEFGEDTGPNPGSEFGFRVWRKERVEPFFCRFRVWRKNLANPWFGAWFRCSEKGLGQTLVWQVWSSEKGMVQTLVGQVQSSEKERH